MNADGVPLRVWFDLINALYVADSYEMKRTTLSAFVPNGKTINPRKPSW